MHMKIRKILIAIAIFLGISLTSFFLFRNTLLNYAVSKAGDEISKKYKATLITGDSRFAGFRTIRMENLMLVRETGDTILKINSLLVNPSYQSLMFGKLGYKMLLIDDIAISLSEGSNAQVDTIKKSATPVDSTARATDPLFGSKLNSLFFRLFELITGETTVRNFSAELKSGSNYRKYLIPVFTSDSRHFSCPVFNVTQKDTIAWSVTGFVKKDIKSFDFRMIRESAATSMVNLTTNEKGFKWLVDTLYFEARIMSYKNNEIVVGITGDFSNLQLNHWRISAEDVIIKNGKVNLVIRAGKNYIKTDTASTVTINKYQCRMGIGFESKGPVYKLSVRTNRMPSDFLFESLPQGMFASLQGIRTKGELSYSLDFSVDRRNPDSLIFDSELRKYNFSIRKFGNEYLPKINGEFLYTAYDRNHPVRTFPVGPSNPAFTPLDQINPFLKNAVMTSEDGSFLVHSGFNEEAFRQSIATNLKQGRFARGGSTISMQLVKNVFLSRNKTISRKLEEALIVWLMEKNRLVSKERMFEVYLNIIEWGPNVYGVKEASMFYFDKHPSQLSLAESIFLASIIPHPKHFKYSFDQAGQLKPFLSGFYRLVSDRMLRKNWILPEDTVNLRPVVQLTGPALQLIIPTDTIPEADDDDDDFIN